MKEEFLKCLPTVFVIGNEYEIFCWAKVNGVFCLQIGNERYYEENSGVLSSEKPYVKIRVPQSVLNASKGYEVVFRETVNRRAYYPELLSEQVAFFAFQPMKKIEDIHIYHIADVHYRFDLAKKTAEYFEDDVDLFVVNGDIGEVETEENYFEVANFVGLISQGRIPVVFARGNHDIRGKLAEKYVEFFPCNGKKTYFTFELGCLSGIVLDCGEDKQDDCLNYEAMATFNASSPYVYGGVNRFSAYRSSQLEYLRSLSLNQNSIRFAISHICPVMTTYKKGDEFDIERECYNLWNEELERLGVEFMLCGHMHKAHVLDSDSSLNTLPHKYPVIIGSACFKDDFWGAALIVNKNEMEVRFTDKDKNVRECFCIALKK